jgi:hypothetical protein
MKISYTQFIWRAIGVYNEGKNQNQKSKLKSGVFQDTLEDPIQSFGTTSGFLNNGMKKEY